MRSRILLVVLLATLSGCAQLEAVFKTPAKSPAPPAPRPVPPSSPPAPLQPVLPAGEERRLMEDAQRKIGEVEHVLRSLEGRALKPPQEETLLTARGFLDQARGALDDRDYERAANLASKARALGDDLAARTK